ncbi:MAG: helix-turn-helix transcriptional regulator, partial [Syntrophorhabdaceae bacterium]
VTTESLCEDLGKCKRTIQRYVATLGIAGFPIEYDRTRKTYAFTNNYTLKKPHLSVEEALAFSLAKKLLGNIGPGMEKSLISIEDKLDPGKKTDLKNIFLSPENLPGQTGEYLTLIHQAIADYRKMKIKYKAFGAKKATISSVDPYYLFFRNGLWYFRGLYEADKAVRTFALDRIESLSLVDRHFMPASFAPEEELSGAFGAFLDGEPVDVVLRFDESYKPLITRKTWHSSQQVTDLPDGGIEVIFTVKGTLGIRNWIYQWIPHVEVVAPQELRDMFCDDLNNALKLHGKKN